MGKDKKSKSEAKKAKLAEKKQKQVKRGRKRRRPRTQRSMTVILRMLICKYVGSMRTLHHFCIVICSIQQD